MKIACLIAAVIFAWSGAAHAAVEIDQSNVVLLRSGARMGTSALYYQPSFLVSRIGQMQSVTAGKEGVLRSVDLQLINYGDIRVPVIFNIGIVDGEPGINGKISPVGLISLSTSDLPRQSATESGVMVNVDLSSLNYLVKVGQKFSILMSLPDITIPDNSTTSGGPAWVYGLINISDNTLDFSNYAGGFNTVIDGDGSRAITASDRGFRTYVNVTAVPEIETWIMAITGFFMVAGAIRYRRLNLACS